VTPGRLLYPACAALLLALYLAGMTSGGYRLPFYYTPDGDVLPIASSPEVERFLEIEGRDPGAYPALFTDPDPVMALTERGAVLIDAVPNDAAETAFDFKFVILFSFIYLLLAVWFLQSGNDIHLAAFCAALSLFNFFTVMGLAYHRFEFLWHAAALAAPPTLLNVGLRTTGKELPGSLLLAELVGFVFLALIGYVGLENAETLRNLEALTINLFFGALVIVILLQLDNALRSTDDPIERFKRWTLFGGTVVGLFLPTLFMRITLSFGWGAPLDWILLVGLIYPITLVYGAYRLHLLPFQFVLTRSIVAALVSLFLAVLYGIVLLIHSLLLPEQQREYQWIVHVVFLLILVFFLDPAQRWISRFIQRNVFRLDARLTESLKRMAALIASNNRIQPTAVAFLDEIRDTLGLEKASFLFSTPALPQLQMRNEALHRIAADSPFWRYIEPDRMLVTSYLTYAGGQREELYHYLYKHRYLLAIGVLGPRSRWSRWTRPPGVEEESGMNETSMATIAGEQIRAALLVGARVNRRKLELKETRYLQEAAKLAGMLIYNYSLLMQEIEKRRRIRDLTHAGQMQRSMIGPARQEEIQGVYIAHFGRPAISVTGDYLDLIPLSRRRFALILGDVTGHGLGTGFLVSSIQAIIRSHLENGRSLVDSIMTLNLFLMERYQGNEFITIFAMILNADSGEMDYINAAHPGPFVRRSTGEFQQLKSNQRIIGILPTPYFSNRTRLEPGDRLFLYSDGVTETFNMSETAFGEGNLRDFLRRHGEDPIDEIPPRLEHELEIFRGTRLLTDDTTFLAMEYAPRFAAMRSLLQFFGLDRGENRGEP